jgi:hypothetical protein
LLKTLHSIPNFQSDAKRLAAEILCFDCNNASFNYGYILIVEPFAALSLLTFLRQYPALEIRQLMPPSAARGGPLDTEANDLHDDVAVVAKTSAFGLRDSSRGAVACPKLAPDRKSPAKAQAGAFEP